MTLIADPTVGIAGVSTDTFTQVELLSGDTPAIVTTNEPISAALLASGAPARQVVGRNGSGELIKAVLGTTAAIGILVAPIAAGTSSGSKAPTYRAGCFNPAALVWDATYDTAEKKRLAFDATAPLIFIKTSPVA